MNLHALRAEPGFTLHEADVAEGLAIDGDVDLVVHLASPASPADYLRHPLATLDAGSRGTRNASIWRRGPAPDSCSPPPRRYTATPRSSPQTETYWGNVNPVGPRSVYDEAKRFAEAMTAAYRRAGQVNTGIVRIFNTYGPGMRPGDGRIVSHVCLPGAARPAADRDRGRQPDAVPVPCGRQRCAGILAARAVTGRPGQHRQSGRGQLCCRSPSGSSGWPDPGPVSSTSRCRKTTRRRDAPTSRWPGPRSAGSPDLLARGPGRDPGLVLRPARYRCAGAGARVMRVLGINAIFHDPRGRADRGRADRRRGRRGTVQPPEARQAPGPVFRLGTAGEVRGLVPGVRGTVTGRPGRGRVLLRPCAVPAGWARSASTTPGTICGSATPSRPRSSWRRRCPAWIRPSSVTSATTRLTPPPRAWPRRSATRASWSATGAAKPPPTWPGTTPVADLRSWPARRCRTHSGCSTSRPPLTWVSFIPATNTR